MRKLGCELGLLAQRVNKRFKEVITILLSIPRALFFEPVTINDCAEAEEPMQPVLNILLVADGESAPCRSYGDDDDERHGRHRFGAYGSEHERLNTIKKKQTNTPLSESNTLRSSVKFCNSAARRARRIPRSLLRVEGDSSQRSERVLRMRAP